MQRKNVQKGKTHFFKEQKNSYSTGGSFENRVDLIDRSLKFNKSVKKNFLRLNKIKSALITASEQKVAAVSLFFGTGSFPSTTATTNL